MGRRRIWCETLPYAELRSPRVLALLERYRIELLLAVRPWDLGALPDVVRACADHGVSLGLWPMIENEAGRWANADNAWAFSEFARRVAEHAPKSLAVDLEPPFDMVKKLFDGDRPLHTMRAVARGDGGKFDEARETFRALAIELRARKIDTVGVVVPLVLFDRDGGTGWQRVLGTPVTSIPWSRVDVMLYTSLIEGWSRGLLRRVDALAFLRAGCEAALRRYGPGTSVSLGTVGTGALEDEPMYRDVDELRADIAVARAAGVEHLTLFDLAGVLRRPSPEPWLEAFVDPRPTPPPESSPRRVRAAVAAMRAIAPLLGRRKP